MGSSLTKRHIGDELRPMSGLEPLPSARSRHFALDFPWLIKVKVGSKITCSAPTRTYPQRTINEMAYIAPAFCVSHLPQIHRRNSSTASTTIQPYQTSDYVSFTSNSDLSARDRAPPTGLSDELQYRNSLPEPVNEHVLLERKRGNHGRSNSLHTQQLRALKQDKVSRLNSVEPSSSYSPIERETIQTREKDSQTLNERVQIPSTQEREKAQFKQNYFKPIGARNTNSYTVANNQAVLHQRTATQNGRDSDENIVAMGTLVGSSNAGTSPALKSSRSSSGSTGGGQQTHINVQSTSNPQQAAHLNQGSSGVNLNVRKFNSRFGQSNQSPYFNTGHSLSKQRDEEPRYPDPLNGAPSSFQQRVAELASLEADTIRHERAKKLKKRNKES